MKKILLTTWLLAAAGSLLAQAPPPAAGLRSTTDYTVEEIQYYKIPKSAKAGELSPLDLQKTQKRRTVKQVSRQVALNGDHSSVTLILNPKEAYKDWPTPVTRIEVDQQGTRSFAADSTLLHETAADSAYSVRYLDRKTQLATSNKPVLSEFPLPDSAGLADLANDGWAVSNLGDTLWQVVKGNQTIVYDLKRRQTTVRFSAGAQVTKEVSTQYQLNKDGLLVPKTEMTTEVVTRPSGVCLERVFVRNFSDYVVKTVSDDREPDERSAVDGRSNRLAVFPNPAQQEVMLQLDASVPANASLQVRDFNGQTVVERLVPATDKVVRVPLTGLPNGFYSLQIQTAAGVKSFKFVKQAPQ